MACARDTRNLRLTAVRSESGALLLDDTYNASPESMLAALNLLAEWTATKWPCWAICSNSDHTKSRATRSWACAPPKWPIRWSRSEHSGT